MDILHCFADEGVESEVLTGFGTVVRVGIDPEANRYSHAVQADGCKLPFSRNTFDIGIFHPLCQRFSHATPPENKDDFPNQIPAARSEAQRVCENYIIENVPKAPLQNPVYLNGKMFGMQIKYERAFETSYHVPQPPRERGFAHATDFAEDQGKGGWNWIGSKVQWGLEKGYAPNEWSSDGIKRTAVPRPYLKWLLAPLFDTEVERTIPETQRSRNPEPNASLSEF